jgi:ADP-heptose:LPS heptosyltransferase
VHFDPGNILIIDFGQLGDVVLSLPALRAIRQRFPHARITVAAGRPASDIVRLSGFADEVMEVDRVGLRDGWKVLSIARIIKFVGRVRKAKFDFVIDLHSLSETNLLGFLSGAPQRLYARRPGRSLDYLSNFNPRPPAEAKESHLVDRYLDVLKPLGLENLPRTPRLKTSPVADSAVEAIFKREKIDSGSLLVGIFPGAGFEGRRWPLERFAELADYLIRNDRVRVLVFAGPEETHLVGTMRSLFPPSTIFFDRLTISQLVSAQARLTLFISNDTGPSHTAAAAGTPVIVLMDQPTVHSYIPIGDQLRLLGGARIAEITVEQVYKEAHELLASNRMDHLFSYSESP